MSSSFAHTSKQIVPTDPDEHKPADCREWRTDFSGERQMIREHTVEERRRDNSGEDTREEECRAEEARFI